MDQLSFQDLGVQELNAQELQELEGGDFMDGFTDCYTGVHDTNGDGWYQVGWLVQCLAGGYGVGKPYKV